MTTTTANTEPPTRTAAAPCSAEVEWHSGGPGKSAFEDYRWQCACGNRYEALGDGINGQHYAHLAEAQFVLPSAA